MRILFGYNDIMLNFRDGWDKEYIDRKLLRYIESKIGHKAVSYGLELNVLEVNNRDNIVVYSEHTGEEYIVTIEQFYYPKTVDETIYAYSEVNYKYECADKSYKLSRFKLYEITGMERVKCRDKEIIFYKSNDIIIPMVESIRLLLESKLHIYNIVKEFKLKYVKEEEVINEHR